MAKANFITIFGLYFFTDSAYIKELGVNWRINNRVKGEENISNN